LSETLEFMWSLWYFEVYHTHQFGKSLEFLLNDVFTEILNSAKWF